MKKSLKKYFLNNRFIYIFKFLKEIIKPNVRIWGNSNYNYTSSDSFFWRTDNGYTTIFRYSDIAKKYLNSDSDILLIFLDDNGKYIDEKIFKVQNSVNTFIIDSKIVPDNQIGSFFAFIIPKDLLSKKLPKLRIVVMLDIQRIISFIHLYMVMKLPS